MAQGVFDDRDEIMNENAEREGAIAFSTLHARIEQLEAELKEARAEVELWKDREAATRRDFETTIDTPCPTCGEKW